MPRKTVVSPRGTSGAVVALPKPGTSIRWNVFEAPSFKRIEGLSGNNISPRFARSDLTSGNRQVFRQLGGFYHVEIQLIGWRTLIIDQHAVSRLVISLASQVTEIAGEFVRDSAYEDSTFRNVTGDTRRSLLKDPVMLFESGDIIAEMGPTTFYSPFLEFGWFRGGNLHIFPFMIPALWKHKIDFINGLIDVMGIVAGERPYAFRPPIGKDGRIRKTMSRARSFLYTTEKALGDVAVVSGSRFISPVRSLMLTMAKELGDMSAVMGGTVATRVFTRIRGAVTGRALGYTRTVSVDKTYSGFPGGGGNASVGGRVYNRIVGRATRPIAVGSGR